ncbi:ornithine decarboxylase family protein [Oesophagostomum dentatum]|uniref:ornithine decarboxylase n=1 Tax=Oesophagostomum dentatum TaxID=61180 RepID=A0A0B1S928_OESDE|nr:ornithine decarboxylase family protein [Oesophagostomum dentatum]
MKIDNVYQHDGLLDVTDLARKIAEDYDARNENEPFSIIDLDVVKGQLDLWKDALPSVKPYYAVKCNSDLNILKTLSANGVCFDCASAREIELVQSNELATGNDIILAHPIKSRQCVEFAVANGIRMMTFDSVEELRKICSITKEAKLILRIRVSGFESLVDLNKKFGADDITSKLIFHEAAKMGVKIHGISFHMGSGVENCRPLALSLAVARQVLDYGRLLGHPLDLLDIGGGFMATSKQAFLKIGNFIENTLRTCFKGVPLSVIAEPGRFFVTDAQYVVARVNQVVLKFTAEDLPAFHSIYLNDGVYGSFNFVLTEKRRVKGIPLRSNFACSSAKYNSSAKSNIAIALAFA